MFTSALTTQPPLLATEWCYKYNLHTKKLKKCYHLIVFYFRNTDIPNILCLIYIFINFTDAKVKKRKIFMGLKA